MNIFLFKTAFCMYFFYILMFFVPNYAILAYLIHRMLQMQKHTWCYEKVCKTNLSAYYLQVFIAGGGWLSLWLGN